MRPSFTLARTLVLAFLLAGCFASAPRFTRYGSERASGADSSGRRASPLESGGNRAGIPARTEIPDRAKIPERAGIPELAESNPKIDRHALLSVIMGKMGIPYDYNGADSNGMDCSGLVTTVYQEGAGIRLPRTSQEQYAAGSAVGEGSLQFGDLVFFNTTGRMASHVGVYVGDGLFAHASVSNGVTISLLSQDYYRRRFTGARRIVR